MKLIKFRSKHTFTPQEEEKDEEAEKRCWLTKFCKIAGDIEAKMCFSKYVTHSLKLIFGENSCCPKINVSNLIQYKRALFGVNYTFDHTKPKMSENLEVLGGFQSKKKKLLAFVKA